MSEPTLEPAKSTIRRLLPELRSPWWAALLIASMMANFLIVGAAIGFKFHGGRGPKGFAQSSEQLLPREFLFDLQRERRREFMDLLRVKNDNFKQNRDATDVTSLKFADALDQPNFDQAKAKSIVEEITSGPNSFAAQSEALVLEVTNKLTPDERKALAEAIRDRVSHHGRK